MSEEELREIDAEIEELVNPSFAKLISDADDETLCEEAFDRIGDSHIDPRKLSREERAVVLVWHCGAIIDNGGFEYLFGGDFAGDEDYRLTAEAFHDVGLSRCYEAFQEAFALFPDGDVPSRAEVRHPLYCKADKNHREAITEKFYEPDPMTSNGAERAKAVAVYIRAHADAFKHIK